MVRAANGRQARGAESARRWERRLSAWVLGVALAAPLVHVLHSSPAQAAPPRAGAAASKRAKAPKAKAAPKAPPSAAQPSAARPSAAPPSAASPSAAPPSVARPEAPVSAPTSPAAPSSDVVRTEERAGEKTYTFGAQEVEGRLKSPQILYFLRRVRAQFDPAPLGHRSFLLELSDTRRHPALE